MAPRRLLAAQVRLDLQTATAAELEALPEIGPHLAQRIVAVQQARAARGEPPLRTRAELLRISGIGEKKLERLLPFLNPLP
jgi:competence protein ComEA